MAKDDPKVNSKMDQTWPKGEWADLDLLSPNILGAVKILDGGELHGGDDR